MGMETSGTVISAKKQWWLKVNTRSLRKGTFDGATFPYVIKVSYRVEGIEYIRRKWIKASAVCPSVGTTVKVVYQQSNPKKSRVIC